MIMINNMIIKYMISNQRIMKKMEKLPMAYHQGKAIEILCESQRENRETEGRREREMGINRKRGRGKNIFDEIMAENFTSLVKVI